MNPIRRGVRIAFHNNTFLKETPLNTLLRGCAILLVFHAALGHAQSDRAETWEFGGSVLDMASVEVAGPSGSSLSVDDDIGFGVTGAYHFTSRLGVGLDISHTSPSYVATFVPDNSNPPQRVKANLGVDVIHLKGIFNLLDSDFTPYLELGAGWTYVDSNIISGPGGTTCWWDPWWGYICSSYFDTYSETRTSHSYAFGIRYEFDSEWILKGSWGVHNIDTNRSSEDIELDTINISFSWRF